MLCWSHLHTLTLSHCFQLWDDVGKAAKSQTCCQVTLSPLRCCGTWAVVAVGLAREASWPEGAGPGAAGVSAASALGLAPRLCTLHMGSPGCEVLPFLAHLGKRTQCQHYLVEGCQHTMAMAMPKE